MKFKVTKEKLEKYLVSAIYPKDSKSFGIYDFSNKIEVEGEPVECRNCRIDNVTEAIKGSSIRKLCFCSEKTEEGFCSECGLRGTKELPLWKHDHRQIPVKDKKKLDVGCNIFIDREGKIYFEGEYAYVLLRKYQDKIDEAEQRGKESVVHNIIKNIEKLSK